jgi:hypothetical protein
MPGQYLNYEFHILLNSSLIVHHKTDATWLKQINVLTKWIKINKSKIFEVFDKNILEHNEANVLMQFCLKVFFKDLQTVGQVYCWNTLRYKILQNNIFKPTSMTWLRKTTL